jgi:hypothetical protein
MPSIEPDVERVERQLEASRRAATASDKVADHVLMAEWSDRSWIARGVIWMFVVAILGVLAIYLLQGFMSGDWTSVARQASELVRSDVLPIVTLILGYYFGRSGRG